MKSLNDIQDDRPGDEVPRLKDIIMVVVVVAVLTVLSLIIYKLGWLN